MTGTISGNVLVMAGITSKISYTHSSGGFPPAVVGSGAQDVRTIIGIEGIIVSILEVVGFIAGLI